MVAVGLMISPWASRAQGTGSMIGAAEQGLLPVVTNPPPVGTFYSWQRPWQPPLPENPFSDCVVYDAGDGMMFLIPESGVKTRVRS